MRIRHAVTIAIVPLLVTIVIQQAGRVDDVNAAPPADLVLPADNVTSGVRNLDEWFAAHWKAEGVTPAEPAQDLAVLRRLSLALFGTVPSLEEIRAFEADTEPNRIDRWVIHMLKDQRFGDYFADRLSRSLVGVEQGPFIVFRRDQLNQWLARQLMNDRPWSELARELIASDGLWTDRPATNFITIARIDDEGLDENKLAGRVVRTFLGQRIDCAQCHNHPFDERWKQGDFEGLAAWFCQAQLSLRGVSDLSIDEEKKPVVYRVTDPGHSEEEARVISPAVPFGSEWLPESGSHRERLAAWVTHPENRRFERAIANRIWGLMFGKPLRDPVDDLPHPEGADVDALDILGREFRGRGDRLSTLIRMIAGSKVFQQSSESKAESETDLQSQSLTWAVFPLVRLRPEQVIGSLFQAGHLRSIDQNSHVFVRLQRFGNENDFINEYGDAGEDELNQQVGTIPQALLRMNGRFTMELSKVDTFTAAGEILSLSPDDASAVDNAFLCCLSRRPSQEERTYFVELLHHADDGEAAKQGNPARTGRYRNLIMQDLYWSLFNSPEFSWNH